MKLPNLNLQRWFTPASPQFATSTGGDDRSGTTLFSSRSGGSSGGDDDYGFDDDPTKSSEAPAEPSRTARGGGSGSGGNRGNGSGGRQRTIQFQPEDRYWTEYLRIALPIIGLILMLGLFWFWATKIIGDDTDTTDPTPTEVIGAVSTIGADPTQTTEATTETTVAVTPEPTEPSAEPTGTTEGGGDNATEVETPEDSGDEATQVPADSGTGDFEADDLVVINDEGDGGVNMRSGPTTAEENIVVQLQPGDELTIVDGPEEGDGYTWYEVLDDAGNNGYVAVDYLDPAP